MWERGSVLKQKLVMTSFVKKKDKRSETPEVVCDIGNRLKLTGFLLTVAGCVGVKYDA